MKTIRYALPLITILMITGCGPQRKASRSAAPALEAPSDMPRIILYPKGYEGEMEMVEITPSVEYEDVLEGIAFSGLETEHVRVKGVNPLPASGRLEVDLDRLQGRFVYPYRGRFLSDYGMRNGRPHTGIDIKTVPNDTIRAVLPGVVRMSKTYSSYGNIVVIRHPEGFETVYAHCSQNLVGVNDRVQAGTPIGLAGRTGRATTEHLHFEVRVAGDPVDPKKLLDVDKERLRSGMFYAESHGGSVIAYNDPAELTNIKQDLAASQSSPTQAPEPKVETAPGRGSSAGAAGTQYHTVVKGDTLYALARKYSTTVKELCRLNGIAETSVLSLGKKLRVK